MYRRDAILYLPFWTELSWLCLKDLFRPLDIPSIQIQPVYNYDLRFNYVSGVEKGFESS